MNSVIPPVCDNCQLYRENIKKMLLLPRSVEVTRTKYMCSKNMSEEKCKKGEGDTNMQSEPLDLSIAAKQKTKTPEKEAKTKTRSEQTKVMSQSLEKTRKWVNSSDFTNCDDIDESPGTSGYCEGKDRKEREIKTISHSDGEVKVTLMHPQLWNEFNHIQNEMIINKRGRQMFPVIELLISGLQPERFYCVSLQIIPADNMRYRFVDDTWRPQGVTLWSMSKKVCFHPCSPSKGSFWMDDAIAFKKVKLANGPGSNPETIHLKSMNKYMTKVNVMLLRNDTHDVERVYTFDFPETNFIAVTAYQNKAVTNLKICNNPFAKGFRIKTPEMMEDAVMFKKQRVSSSVSMWCSTVYPVVDNYETSPVSGDNDRDTESSLKMNTEEEERRLQTDTDVSTSGMNLGQCPNWAEVRNFANLSRRAEENTLIASILDKMFVEMAPWHKEEFMNAYMKAKKE